MDKLTKIQIIAVEEHLPRINTLTGWSSSPCRRMRKPSVFMTNFAKSSIMRRRTIDTKTRLAEMDSSGTDISVSLNPPGVQKYSDSQQAISLRAT
jgi:hypothetical protein